MFTELNKKLLDELYSEGGKIYLVGGPVRDYLTNRQQIKDTDYLIAGIPFKKLSLILKKYGIVNPVGQSFGVIKFKSNEIDEVIDISLPRKEHSTGIGHKDFEIDFDHRLNVEDDLGRRDFTINAIAMDIRTKKIIDPYNGRDDLENKLLRIVSDSSFFDDPLRMLRGVQFAARFELTIESETYLAMKTHAPLIESVSAERIAEEINKLLVLSQKPSVGFEIMYKTGILKIILPELEQTAGVDQPGGYHKWDVFRHTLKVVDAAPMKLRVRLAALFHDIGKPATRRLIENGATFYGHDKTGSKLAETALKRLKYSNDVIRDVCKLIEKHMFSEDAGDKGVRRLISKVGEELIDDLIKLRRADTIGQGMGQTTDSLDEFEMRVNAELESNNAFGIKDLDIDGTVLMKEFGLPESPLIGEILAYLLEKVLDGPELNNYQQLLNLAKRFLDKRQLDIDE